MPSESSSAGECHGMGTFATEEACAAACAYDAHGVAVTDETVSTAKAADAVILRLGRRAEVDKVPYEHRPEAGLLRLRKDLQLYANLRPAVTYPAIGGCVFAQRELVEGLDIMILRELTGGVYSASRKTITDSRQPDRARLDTQVYDTYEIERISRVAFELARKRRNKVTSMDKRNVMKTGVLWNEVVTQVHSREFPDVQLEHVLADSVACSLCARRNSSTSSSPDNLFGDMLSDIAAMLTGIARHADLSFARRGRSEDQEAQGAVRRCMLGPRHRRQGGREPIAMIASFAMALRYRSGC